MKKIRWMEKYISATKEEKESIWMDIHNVCLGIDHNIPSKYNKKANRHFWVKCNDLDLVKEFAEDIGLSIVEIENNKVHYYVNRVTPSMKWQCHVRWHKIKDVLTKKQLDWIYSLKREEAVLQFGHIASLHYATGSYDNGLYSISINDDNKVELRVDMGSKNLYGKTYRYEYKIFTFKSLKDLQKSNFKELCTERTEFEDVTHW